MTDGSKPIIICDNVLVVKTLEFERFDGGEGLFDWYRRLGEALVHGQVRSVGSRYSNYEGEEEWFHGFGLVTSMTSFFILGLRCKIFVEYPFLLGGED